jgi:hypothetical protein
MGLIGSPEASVSIHLTPRNNPEDGRIQEETVKLSKETGSVFCFRVELNYAQLRQQQAARSSEKYS